MNLLTVLLAAILSGQGWTDNGSSDANAMQAREPVPLAGPTLRLPPKGPVPPARTV